MKALKKKQRWVNNRFQVLYVYWLYWWMVVTNLFNTVFAKMSLPACSILIWQKWWIQTQTFPVVLIISGRETRTNSSFYGQTYLHKVESHWRNFMFISIVLDAFVTSVIYKPPYLPPVRFCNNSSCSKHGSSSRTCKSCFLVVWMFSPTDMTVLSLSLLLSHLLLL